MWAGAEDGVVVVVRVGAIGHVRAHQRMDHVDVVHRVDRALQFEIAEVEELRDEDVRLEELEEPDASQSPADAERADARQTSWCRPGSSGSDET